MLTYFNNVLIFLKNKNKHKKYIKEVLKRLCKTNLYINIDKYKFNVIKTKYLDLIISKNNIFINLNKIKAIIN